MPSGPVRKDAYERVAGDVSTLEEGLRELRGEIGDAREGVSQQELQLRETEMKRDHLDASIREKWDVELVSWEPPAVEEAEASSRPPAAVSPVSANDVAVPLNTHRLSPP